MKIISSFNDYLRNINESLYFKMGNRTYGWINDDKEDYMNTSMFVENGEIRAVANKKTLNRSGVISYNLYNINDFKAAKVIKHNYAFFNDEKINFKPDSTITDFNNYTINYIIKLLSFLNINIDILLTPYSSSDLNKTFLRKISNEYLSKYNKKIKVIDDAFIKTPKNIKIDKTLLRKAATIVVDYENNHYDISDERRKILIDDMYDSMYDFINLDNMNSLIEPYYKEIKEFKKELNNLDQYKISNYDKIDELENTINKKEKELKLKFPNYEQSSFYIEEEERRLGKKKKNKKDWEVKKIPDVARYALSNMQGFSETFNNRFIITNKDGNFETDKTILYTGKEKFLIFDDNLASGSTVDDICVRLIENGVDSKDIVVLTLGLVPENKKFKK